jgi:propanediol dehydratase small subunit
MDSELDPQHDYPLGARRPDLVTTPAGVALSALTLQALRAGEIHGPDMRATPETLGRQATVARAAGRRQLAENLERAAELASVPEQLLLDVYTALRPRRATADELEGWATSLEEHGATKTAAFVREAAAAYDERGLLADA